MKILVTSDTHGNYMAPVATLEESGAEMLIHLGDEINDAHTLDLVIDIPILKVPGNCDLGAREPRELVETISGKKLLITHGDLYRVKSGLEKLKQRALDIKADIVLFGHTHIPMILKDNGILYVNPGSMMQGDRGKSCALITLSKNNISAEIIHLP